MDFNAAEQRFQKQVFLESGERLTRCLGINQLRRLLVGMFLECPCHSGRCALVCRKLPLCKVAKL